MQPTHVTKQVLAAGSKAWDGSPLPNYPANYPAIIIARITLPPHSSLEPHIHPVINAGMVISGTLTVTSADGVTQEFGPGQAIIEMVGKPHYGQNLGDEPVDLVMFYAAVPGAPLSLPVTNPE